jgi:hypothetical protein
LLQSALQECRSNAHASLFRGGDFSPLVVIRISRHEAWAEASQQVLVEKWFLVHRDLRARPPPPTLSSSSQPASRALLAQATTRNTLLEHYTFSTG